MKRYLKDSKTTLNRKYQWRRRKKGTAFGKLQQTCQDVIWSSQLQQQRNLICSLWAKRGRSWTSQNSQCLMNTILMPHSYERINVMKDWLRTDSGWKIVHFPVEVGCRGFVSHRITGLLLTLGLSLMISKKNWERKPLDMAEKKWRRVDSEVRC